MYVDEITNNHLKSSWIVPTRQEDEQLIMMTSSNGNIFRVTGPLWGEPLVTGRFPSQRPETWSFDVFFDGRLNKKLSKQSQKTTQC